MATAYVPKRLLHDRATGASGDMEHYAPSSASRRGGPCFMESSISPSNVCTPGLAQARDGIRSTTTSAACVPNDCQCRTAQRTAHTSHHTTRLCLSERPTAAFISPSVALASTRARRMLTGSTAQATCQSWACPDPWSIQRPFKNPQ